MQAQWTVKWVRQSEWDWSVLRLKQGLPESIQDPVTLDKMAAIVRGVRRQERGVSVPGANVGG
jgi:hypothetical protein